MGERGDGVSGRAGGLLQRQVWSGVPRSSAKRDKRVSMDKPNTGSVNF